MWPESVLNIQSQIQALLLEVGRGPGSLYSEIMEDSEKAPEASWDAHVRLGEELCVAERAYLRERKRRMRSSFAKFIGVEDCEVVEDDIPIVAIAGSGGGKRPLSSPFFLRVLTALAGYRAMTNTIGSLVGAKESGLLNCVTYIAGISGSCWALGVLYSGIPNTSSLPDLHSVAEHIKDRVSKSFLDIVTLELLTTPPTNKVRPLNSSCTFYLIFCSSIFFLASF